MNTLKIVVGHTLPRGTPDDLLRELHAEAGMMESFVAQKEFVLTGTVQELQARIARTSHEVFDAELKANLSKAVSEWQHTVCFLHTFEPPHAGTVISLVIPAENHSLMNQTKH